MIVNQIVNLISTALNTQGYIGVVGKILLIIVLLCAIDVVKALIEYWNSLSNY